MRAEFDELRIELRGLGSKPSVDDLIAALIHAAHASAEETKRAVEEHVKHELAVERRLRV